MTATDIQPIRDRALAGRRLTTDDCTALLESHDVAKIGAAADEIRQRKHPDNIVTYIIDRNVNERLQRRQRARAHGWSGISRPSPDYLEGSRRD